MFCQICLQHIRSGFVSSRRYPLFLQSPRAHTGMFASAGHLKYLPRFEAGASQRQILHVSSCVDFLWVAQASTDHLSSRSAPVVSQMILCSLWGAGCVQKQMLRWSPSTSSFHIWHHLGDFLIFTRVDFIIGNLYTCTLTIVQL